MVFVETLISQFEEENLTDQQLWADVSGDGLEGTWARPSAENTSPFSLIIIGGPSGASGLRLLAGADGGSVIGLTANGTPLEVVQFSALYEGITFDLSAPPETDPIAYFSNYIGTYNATSSIFGGVEPDGGGSATFTVNTLTIIPEPSAAILISLGAATLLLRRTRTTAC